MNGNGYDRKILTKLYFSLLPVQILLAAIGSVNGIVSSLFAGNYLGSDAMSAVGLYGPFGMLTGAVSTMFVGGSLLLCGEYMGKNQVERTQAVFSLDLLATFVIAAVFTVLLVIAAGFDLLGVMAPDAAVRAVFNRYVLGMAIGIIPLMLGQQLSAFLSLEHRMKLTMAASLIYIAVNVLLNYLFVVVLHMEAFGLALASSLGVWTYFLVQAGHYFSGRSMLKLSFRDIHLREAADIVRIGLPGALSNGYQTIRSLIVNMLILNSVGAVGIAAFTASNSLLNLFWAIPGGMLTVSRMLISISVGEEDRRSLVDIMRIVMYRCIPLMCAVSCGIILFSDPLTMLYYRDTAEEVFRLTRMCFRILPLCMPFSVMLMNFNCYGQISEKHLLVHLNSLLDGVVCVAGFSALLIRPMGLAGICTANVLNGVVTTLVIIGYSWIVRKQFPRNMEELMVIPDDFGVPEEDRMDLTVRQVDQVAAVSDAVHTFCRDKGIEERRAFLAALCLEEMAGNVVEHGFTKDHKKHSVDLRVVSKGDDLILRIRDDCIHFDPAERKDIVDPDDITKNIGIRIVYSMAEDIRYQNILGLNVLTIRLPAAEAVSA